MQKTVGQPCPDCNTPFIQGKSGAYCKTCYINWKNNGQAPVKPSVPFKTAGEYKKEEQQTAFGKCKHGFLIENKKLGMSLTEAESDAEDWAAASMRKL